MKIVSACLAGVNCKWNGTDNTCPKVVKIVESGTAIPVCPEQLGGLPTPRDPAEMKGDTIITKNGANVTEKFYKGTLEGVKIAKLAGCTEAILKAKSPSCGHRKIYDGTFTKKLIDGSGVFAQKLLDNGISVKTEEDL